MLEGKMMNKKGAELQIVLVVLLTIALVGFTLYTFISKTNSRASDVIQPRFIEKAYIEEGKIRLYLEERAYPAFNQAKEELKDTKENYNEAFKNKFKEILKNKFKEVNPSDNDILNLKNLVVNDKLGINFDGKILQLEVKDIEISVKDENQMILLVYKPEIRISFQL